MPAAQQRSGRLGTLVQRTFYINIDELVNLIKQEVHSEGTLQTVRHDSIKFHQPPQSNYCSKTIRYSRRHQTARWKWHFKNRSRPNTTYTLIFTYTTLFRTHALCATSIKEGVVVALPSANHKSPGHVCMLHPSMCAAYLPVCVTRSSYVSAVYGRKCTRLPAPQRVPISFMFLDPYLVVSYFTFEMVVSN